MTPISTTRLSTAPEDERPDEQGISEEQKARVGAQFRAAAECPIPTMATGLAKQFLRVTAFDPSTKRVQDFVGSKKQCSFREGEPFYQMDPRLFNTPEDKKPLSYTMRGLGHAAAFLVEKGMSAQADRICDGISKINEEVKELFVAPSVIKDKIAATYAALELEEVCDEAFDALNQISDEKDT
ncbi:MAG: hypothetical protein K9M07_02080 [Simkaniaceae bacterium]|nr:hypothetical protein [Simkaniaceae bacterium]MCF7852010.1 hypothetical protein [Simkaniaceae bacterium]